MCSKNQNGFTLLELAIVFVVIGVLLGSIFGPISNQIERRQIANAERALIDVKDALIGYAIVNGRLPCPDTDLDGVENVDADDDCVTTDEPGGFLLPWRDLDVPPADEWGRLYYYRPSPQFVLKSLPGSGTDPNRLDIQDAGELRIYTRAPDGAIRDLTSTAAAVVLSFGPNGLNGRTIEGERLNIAGRDADERHNVDEDDNFATSVRIDGIDAALPGDPDAPGFDSGATAPCDNDSAVRADWCAFDDVVSWISTPQLISRLVEAGHLP